MSATDIAAEEMIEAARAGDVGEAAQLLAWITDCLEKGQPLPEPLRLYLIGALRQITRADSRPFKVPGIENYASPKDYLKALRSVRLADDANAALNLTRPRGRKRPRALVVYESVKLHMMVLAEHLRGKTWEEATNTVADRMSLSERTISRARSLLKKNSEKAQKARDDQLEKARNADNK